MLGRADGQQLRPHRQLARQVEAARAHRGDRVRQPLRGDVRVGQCQVARPVGAEHPLVGHRVGHREDGAQALVPGHHVPQGRFQRGRVQFPGQAQQHGGCG